MLVHPKHRENGDIIQSILVIAIFTIIVMAMVSLLTQSIRSKNSTIFAAGMTTTIQKAELKSVVNPAEVNEYTTGTMTYAELVEDVSGIQPDSVPDSVKNSIVQYIPQPEGHYIVCVESKGENVEPGIYVYNTKRNGAVLSDSCSASNT